MRNAVLRKFISTTAAGQLACRGTMVWMFSGRGSGGDGQDVEASEKILRCNHGACRVQQASERARLHVCDREALAVFVALHGAEWGMLNPSSSCCLARESLR